MRKTLQQVPTFLKLVLILAVILFISYLAPNEEAVFPYQFEQGARWEHPNLVADFDFKLYKTQEEIQKERDSITGKFSPFYELSPAIHEKVKEEFVTLFGNRLNNAIQENQFLDVQNNARAYFDYGNQLLEKYYKNGIIELDALHQSEAQLSSISVYREGGSVQVISSGDLRTKDQVLSLIGDDLPYSSLKEPEFLLPILMQVIQPNLQYNDVQSQRVLNTRLSNYSAVKDSIQMGTILAKKNQILNFKDYQQLLSYKKAFINRQQGGRSFWGIWIGYFLLCFLLIGALIAYLLVNDRNYFISLRHLLFILIWFVIFPYLIYFMEGAAPLSTYLVPLCIVPILLKAFYNERLALFTHTILVLVASFLTKLGYEFTFIQLFAGIVTVFVYRDSKDWKAFFLTIGYMLAAYGLAYLGLSLIKEGNLSHLDPSILSAFVGNAILCLIAYPLIPLLERVFGFISAISLFELADVNRPLLKELAEKASGTYQHSLQVANLAEKAADAIGANALLVRVGALYHDIGKLKNANYFIENQDGENPHDTKTPLESTKIIIKHVIDGVQLGKQYTLPPPIIRFIQTHHGQTQVAYFYHQQLKKDPSHNFDANLFRYPGPKVKTKEETILLLADSIEAAAKSLQQPTLEQIEMLIDKIVAAKIEDHQLEESELSFKELEHCTIVFKQVVKTIHHSRIVYPK